MTLGRAALYVPASSDRKVRRALDTHADSVVIDLEDGVAPDAKESARDALAGLLGGNRRPDVYVRVNAIGTSWHAADLTAVVALGSALRGLVLPKVESADAVMRVTATLRGDAGLAWSGAVVPMIESGKGVLSAADIAAADPHVETLALGTIDLALDLDLPDVEGATLDHARSHLVLACASAGVIGPVDGPHPDLDDEEGLVTGSRDAHRRGFSGRAVLHPRQITPVQVSFAPDPGRKARAREVLDAYAEAAGSGRGAVRLADGTFVDRPVAARAAALLGTTLEDAQ